MFTVFFYQRGPVLTEFKENNTTVCKESYVDLLRRLRERIRRKRPELWAAKSFLIHHDNASLHTATLTLDYLRDNNMDTVPHPPYSPDLAPADYFFFGRVKDQIRGHRHQNIDDMQTAVFRSIKQIPVQEFHDALNFLPLRWMKCIQNEGRYFEGHHTVVDPSDFGLEIFTGEQEQSTDSDSE